FLVEIFAILGLDGGRIVRSVGNRSRRHKQERGYNQPNSTQELILDIRCRSTGAWNEPRAGRGGPALLRQCEHGERAAERGIVAQRGITTDRTEASRRISQTCG